MLFEPNSSSLENYETNRSESIFQDLDQNSDEHQSKPKEEEPRQESSQESGHYWKCTCFAHPSAYSFANNGLQDPNWWPQMAVNPYYDPFNQMANNQRLKSISSDGKPKVFAAKKPTNRSVNQIERLYSCRLCDQINETKDVMSLRKHIEDHLGKRGPFLCQLCGKQFKFRSNCRNHLVAHSVVHKHVRLFPQPLN